MQTGAFSELGPEWLPWAGKLVPELGLGVEAPGPITSEEERARLAEAAGRIFDAIAGGRNLLLVVEDMHWAHSASAQMLHALARSGRPMLVLMTMRDTEPQTEGTQAVDRVIADLAKEGLAERRTLGPLDRGDTETLIRSAIDSAGKPPGSKASAVASVSEGQPLFALELTRAILEAPDRPDLPESLANAIKVRVERASDLARKILKHMAVFGGSVSMQLLGGATGVNPTDDVLVSAVEELLARRLLREEDTGNLTCAHGLIRAAVYKSLSVSRRRALHSRAASAIEDAGELPVEARSEALARHYRLAGDLSSAAEHLLAAAERTAALGEVETASARFRAASDLLRRDGKEREAALALERAGEVLMLDCAVRGSADAFRDALAAWQPLPENETACGRLYTRLAELRTRWGYTRGDKPETQRYVETAIQYVEGNPASATAEERARAYAARSFLNTFNGDSAGAERDAEHALAAAEGAPDVWILAKDAECSALLAAGRFEEALGSALERVPVATRLSNHFELSDAHAMALEVCFRLGDPVAAEKHARLGVQAAVDGRLQFRTRYLSTFLAESLVVQKRFAEAQDVLDCYSWAPAEIEEDYPTTVPLRQLLSDEICASRGDVDTARELISQGARINEIEGHDILQATDPLKRARSTLREAVAKQKSAAAKV
jgi:tetratricopeptide (TPR) repeat protein